MKPQDAAIKSMLVIHGMVPVDWPASSFDALTAEHFAKIETVDPDVVILGTGARQRFIRPQMAPALTSRRIGMDTMDDPVACWTFNILLAEGRRVALALILDVADG